MKKQQLNQVHFLLKKFFSHREALLNSISSVTEPIFRSSNILVTSKLPNLENIPSEENEETSTDFRKIFGCKKDVSTLTKLIKLIKSIFVLVSYLCFQKLFNIYGTTDWNSTLGSVTAPFKLVPTADETTITLIS